MYYCLLQNYSIQTRAFNWLCGAHIVFRQTSIIYTILLRVQWRHYPSVTEQIQVSAQWWRYIQSISGFFSSPLLSQLELSLNRLTKQNQDKAHTCQLVRFQTSLRVYPAHCEVVGKAAGRRRAGHRQHPTHGAPIPPSDASPGREAGEANQRLAWGELGVCVSGQPSTLGTQRRRCWRCGTPPACLRLSTFAGYSNPPLFSSFFLLVCRFRVEFLAVFGTFHSIPGNGTWIITRP